MVVIFSSCEDLDINDNPNKVSVTHPDLLLTNIATSAFQVKGTGGMYASRMIVKQMEKVHRNFINGIEQVLMLIIA